jgi:predicted  nucleic acid-binding Zn-ribbon protein
MTEIENAERERDQAVTELAAAQQRIAELESQVAHDFRYADSCEKQIADLSAALRAITPVWRAADVWEDTFTGTSALDALECAISTARAALTPELMAVIEAATK